MENNGAIGQLPSSLPGLALARRGCPASPFSCLRQNLPHLCPPPATYPVTTFHQSRPTFDSRLTGLTYLTHLRNGPLRVSEQDLHTVCKLADRFPVRDVMQGVVQQKSSVTPVGRTRAGPAPRPLESPRQRSQDDTMDSSCDLGSGSDSGCSMGSNFHHMLGQVSRLTL